MRACHSKYLQSSSGDILEAVETHELKSEARFTPSLLYTNCPSKSSFCQEAISWTVNRGDIERASLQCGTGSVRLRVAREVQHARLRWHPLTTFDLEPASQRLLKRVNRIFGSLVIPIAKKGLGNRLIICDEFNCEVRLHARKPWDVLAQWNDSAGFTEQEIGTENNALRGNHLRAWLYFVSMDGSKAPDRRTDFIFAIIALFLVLQFGIPLVQSGQPGSNRWGWQMYSRYPAVVEYTALLYDGTERAIDIDEHIFRWRFELQPNHDLIRQMCEREPDAESIRVRLDGSDEVDEFRCDD